MPAPRKKALTIVTYSRIAIWLALLFIASGYALQSVQINLLTQSDAPLFLRPSPLRQHLR